MMFCPLIYTGDWAGWIPEVNRAGLGPFGVRGHLWSCLFKTITWRFRWSTSQISWGSIGQPLGSKWWWCLTTEPPQIFEPSPFQGCLIRIPFHADVRHFNPTKIWVVKSENRNEWTIPVTLWTTTPNHISMPVYPCIPLVIKYGNQKSPMHRKLSHLNPWFQVVTFDWRTVPLSDQVPTSIVQPTDHYKIVARIEKGDNTLQHLAHCFQTRVWYHRFWHKKPCWKKK